MLGTPWCISMPAFALFPLLFQSFYQYILFSYTREKVTLKETAIEFTDHLHSVRKSISTKRTCLYSLYVRTSNTAFQTSSLKFFLLSSFSFVWYLLDTKNRRLHWTPFLYTSENIYLILIFLGLISPNFYCFDSFFR